MQVNVTVKNIHFDTLPDKSTTSAVAGYARFVELAQEYDSVYKAIDILEEEGYLY